MDQDSVSSASSDYNPEYYYKLELEIITDHNIDESRLNTYESYILNYYRSGKKITKYDKVSIINNKNCSVYFAKYVISTIFKISGKKFYEHLTYSQNLTIEDIKKIPTNIVNFYYNIREISTNADLYYHDIIDNPEYNFVPESLLVNKNIWNNFSYDDCINLFNYFNISYDFLLLFSINK